MVTKLNPDIWYDRYTKSWVVQFKDGAGNQVREAFYVHSKPEALAIAGLNYAE